MKTTKEILIAAVLLSVLGCATAYQPESFTGGFTGVALAPDVFRVTFRGNAGTSPERAQDFALLRACELTLQNGFTYFAIIDQTNTIRTSSFTTPGYADTTASATGTTTGNIYLNPLGGSYTGTSTTNANATTTYTPAQTYTFYKPQTGLLVRAFHSKPEGIFTFDAAFLQQSLKQQYRIK
jgi:hypothetical protein